MVAREVGLAMFPGFESGSPYIDRNNKKLGTLHEEPSFLTFSATMPPALVGQVCHRADVMS